jgi:hypothetical protein
MIAVTAMKMKQADHSLTDAHSIATVLILEAQDARVKAHICAMLSRLQLRPKSSCKAE